MPPKPRPTARGDYVETETGNKVSRKAQLHGTQHIFLSGRAVIQPDVCIRGDLRAAIPSDPSSKTKPANPTSTSTSTPAAAYNTSVAIGRYTYLGTGSVLRPPSRLHQGAVVYTPLKIGDHVFVGEGCVIEAASIGDHVHVGKRAIVGRMAIIKDGVKVLEGAVVPAGMVVASGSVVGGRPARVVGDVGDGWGAYEGMEGGDMRELWRSVGS